MLQQKEYEPLGSTHPTQADVRIIAATNKDLSTLLARGTFREDLYYRLNVVKIELPPLSKRREDIPLLVDHFIHQFNLKKGKNISAVKDSVLRMLMEYEFPGNIRELENIIEHAFVLCHSSKIEVAHLPKEFVEKFKEEAARFPKSKDRLKTAEVQVIIDALKKHAGNRSQAAADLGIDKSTLWRKMKKFNIQHNK